jgi:hypothetical protein
MAEWLGARLQEVEFPVRVTLVKARGRSTSGSAFWPVTQASQRHKLHRGHSLRAYEVTLRVAEFTLRRQYPASLTYRKDAGPILCQDHWDAIAHTLFHEIRHIQQFSECRAAWPHGPPVKDGGEYNAHATFRTWELREYRSGSCEVDSELVAKQWLAEWRESTGRTQGSPRLGPEDL